MTRRRRSSQPTPRSTPTQEEPNHARGMVGRESRESRQKRQGGSNERVSGRPRSRPLQSPRNAERRSNRPLIVGNKKKIRVLADKTKNSPLHCQPYYHGFMTLEQADAIAENVGDFFVYLSYEAEKKGQAMYVLCICVARNRARHYMIREDHMTPNSVENVFKGVPVKRRYNVDDEHTFESIPSLIKYYARYKVPVDPTENSLLLNPVKVDDWEIDYDKVIVSKFLGEGSFGEVYEGYYMKGPRNIIRCAVKQLKDSSDMENALKEAFTMRYLIHPNVVRLYGVCTRMTPIRLVLELVDGSSLHAYLTSHSDGKISFDEQISRMLMGAAWGIEYLHFNKCIHCDIAARNALYTHDKEIKITDFGMSRQGSVYRCQTKKNMPFRWYPPEVYSTLKFDNLSDVWMFGCLLIEIMTYGKRPYDELNNKDLNLLDLKAFHERGQEMYLPQNTPSDVVKIFRKMVFVPKEKRKDMTTICTELEKEYGFTAPVDNRFLRKRKELKEIMKELN